MRRNFRNILVQWKNHPLRTPLIVRGARQVGKTYSVEAFGREEFEHSLTINCELSSQFHRCFEEMEPKSVIAQIELISRQKIIPGKSLLFLDEIQACPRALQSLRYFKEQLPELHVIAAGSLLEFAMNDEIFSFPVGRIQFARLYPLSFEEYLDACQDSALREALATFEWGKYPPDSVHEHLLRKVKEYFIIGGMPAAVATFLETQSLLEVKYVQKALWDAFESDFSKYAKKSQTRHLKKIFTEIPHLLGDHVKYSRIDPELPNPAREMKQALELLKRAGLIHLIHATSAGSLPLVSGLQENVFKLLFLDIGMVEQAMNLDPNYPGIMSGPLAEQFVGQELLATSDPRLDVPLFFWNREKASAEVDYLVALGSTAYPIEVKAGKAGKLKSLHLFMKEKNVALGIKISQEPLRKNEGILSIPLYLTAHLERLIKSCA